MKKHPIIMGTFILSLANISTRIMGFFYRIYLSRVYGAESLGIFQLTAPVTAMAFAITGAGLQTAISKCVAEISSEHKKKRHRYLLYGLTLALSLSIPMTILLSFFADQVATVFLAEPRTAPLLRILALTFPLSAIHACFHGYFFGKKKTVAPAVGQLIEQLVRIGAVFLLCSHSLALGHTPPLNITIWGILLGEFSAVIVIAFFLLFSKTNKEPSSKLISHPNNQKESMLRKLVNLSVPISLNRLVLNFLHSLEAIRIPLMLQFYGMSATDSLEVFGILTGMVLPILFFPGFFTNALSNMLLPAISEANASKNYKKIHELLINASSIVIFIGIFFGLLFFMFSDFLGTAVFHEPLASSYLRALSLLCPLLYVNIIFSSVLQGLGRVMTVFIIHTTSQLLRLGFVFFAIPSYGIQAYFIGLLVSQVFSGTLLLWNCSRRK